MSLLLARIGKEAIREASRSLRNREEVPLEGKVGIDDPRLTSLLSALEAERMHDYPSGKLFLDSIESALAALLVTSHCAIRGTPIVPTGKLPPWRVRRVLEFIHGNLGKPLRLEKLAARAQLSTSHFAHQFRAAMGTSPHQYVVDLRIARAKELLKNRDRCIIEVAVEVGFENQQHFATVFRRAVGVTPSAYRRLL
jgi:AraC family transcriptional regulator